MTQGCERTFWLLRVSFVAAGFSIGCRDVQADTLEWALVQAYQNNPSLNAQRALLRATEKTCRRLCRAIARS